jgi:hypothetical protein
MNLLMAWLDLITRIGARFQATESDDQDDLLLVARY